MAEPRFLEPGPRWKDAMVTLELLAQGAVLALVIEDATGVCVVPLPGAGGRLFRFLKGANWDRMAMLADKYDPPQGQPREMR